MLSFFFEKYRLSHASNQFDLLRAFAEVVEIGWKIILETEPLRVVGTTISRFKFPWGVFNAFLTVDFFYVIFDRPNKE